jgi:hypothetical protein
MSEKGNKVSTFERNYGLRLIFYSELIDFGLYLRVRPRDWLRTFWGHYEADAIWYNVGPFAFFMSEG